VLPCHAKPQKRLKGATSIVDDMVTEI